MKGTLAIITENLFTGTRNFSLFSPREVEAVLQKSWPIGPFVSDLIRIEWKSQAA